MYNKIELSEAGEYRGRNGVGKLVGLEVMQASPGANVTISGINSRGASNSAWFFFPTQDIPAIIEMLQKAQVQE